MDVELIPGVLSWHFEPEPAPEPIEGRCNAPRAPKNGRSDGLCMNNPDYSDGRCWYHSNDPEVVSRRRLRAKQARDRQLTRSGRIRELGGELPYDIHDIWRRPLGRVVMLRVAALAIVDALVDDA